MKMTCRDIQLALIDADVSEDSAFAAHMADCDECRGFRDMLCLLDGGDGHVLAPPDPVDAEVMVRARQALAKRRASSRLTRHRTPPRWFAAAAALILAGLVWFQVRDRDPAAPQLAQTPLPQDVEGMSWRAADEGLTTLADDLETALYQLREGVLDGGRTSGAVQREGSERISLEDRILELELEFLFEKEAVAALPAYDRG